MIHVHSVEEHPEDQKQFIVHGLVDDKKVVAHGWRSRLGHGHESDHAYMHTILKEQQLPDLPQMEKVVPVAPEHPAITWVKANWITVATSVLLSGLWHFLK